MWKGPEKLVFLKKGPLANAHSARFARFANCSGLNSKIGRLGLTVFDRPGGQNPPNPPQGGILQRQGNKRQLLARKSGPPKSPGSPR